MCVAIPWNLQNVLLNSPPFKFSIRSCDLQNKELNGRKLTKSSSDITSTVADEYIISTDGKVKLKKYNQQR